VILVAHDRWFLEAVTTAVLELEAGRSTYFPGQWHVWRREKAARALDASKSIDRYNADIARLQRFVDRFPVQEVESEAGAGEAHAHRAAEEGEGGRLRRAVAADPPRESGSASSS
jgi:ATP-binding cassette subfamily F protein 3